MLRIRNTSRSSLSVFALTVMTVTLSMAALPNSGGSDPAANANAMPNIGQEPVVGDHPLGSDAAGIQLAPGTLDFGSVFISHDSSMMVTVRNTGDQDLVIDRISVNSAAFTIPQIGNGATVHAGGSTNLAIAFNPPRGIAYRGVVTIHSNAGNADGNGNVTLTLLGIGLTTPSISVDPQGIELGLHTGERQNEMVHVSNIGASDLSFTTNVVITGQPGHDDHGQALRKVDGNVGPRRDDAGQDPARRGPGLPVPPLRQGLRCTSGARRRPGPS